MSAIPTHSEENVYRLQRREAWTRAGPVVSHMPDDQIAMLEERAVATIGDPQPLGLFAFATATWIFGVVTGGSFGNATYSAAIPVMFVFGGLVLFIAGLYAWRRTNVLAATAFCAFAAFNATTAVFFAFQMRGYIAGTGSPVILQGFLLESFAFIALSLAVAAYRANLAWVVWLGLLCVGYCLSGIPNLTGASGNGGWAIVGEIGGWFLVASSAAAAYTGLAYVVNSVWNTVQIPIGGEP